MRISGGAHSLGRAALFFVGLTAAAALVSGCGQKAVASVNGQSLTEPEFAKLCEDAVQVNPQRGSVGLQVVSQWISNTIAAQEAKKLNVYPSQKELDDRIASFGRQMSFMGVDYKEKISQSGLTMDAFKQEMLNSMVSDAIQLRGVNVSDAEVAQEFEKRKKLFTQPEQIHISQITVDSSEKLQKAQSDLKGNADFALVASSYSKDPFAQHGGKVPMALGKQVQPGGPVDQKVIDAAFKLKPGQISEPVKIGATWALVRLDERIPEKVPSVDDMREIMRIQLRREKAQSTGKLQENQRQIMQAQQGAKVEVLRPEYQALMKSIQAQSGGAPGGAPGGGMPPGPPGQ